MKRVKSGNKKCSKKDYNVVELIESRYIMQEKRLEREKSRILYILEELFTQR